MFLASELLDEDGRAPGDVVDVERKVGGGASPRLGPLQHDVQLDVRGHGPDRLHRVDRGRRVEVFHPIGPPA